jgi:hypothetical protein
MKAETNGIETLFSALWKLIVLLVTETPLTLIGIIIILGLYYYSRILFFGRLKRSNKIKTYPYWVQYFFDELMFSKTQKATTIQTFLKLVEFCIVIFLSIAILKNLGFKIPEGIF